MGVEMEPLAAAEEGQRQPGLPLPANPFLNLTAYKPVTPCKKIVNVLMCFTLLPIRIALTIPNIFLCWLICRIAILGLSEDDIDPIKGKPMAAWRRCLLWPVFYIGIRFQLVLFGFWWIGQKGRCASPAEAPIIVANHTSGLIDGIILYKHAKVSEGSYARAPVLSTFMIATQSIFVDRANADSRGQTKQAIRKRAEEPNWPQTVILPEGCCTNGSAVVQFKAGAFSPGVPVQRVLLRFHVGSHDLSFTTPYEQGEYLLKMMMQPANWLTVEYMPVYTPSEEEKNNDIKYANAVQKSIAKALGVPATSHASEDVVLGIAAQKMGLNFDAGVVEWFALTEGLSGLRVKKAVEALKQFQKFDVNQSGEVDLAGFSKAMRASEESGAKAQWTDAQLATIFRLLDKQGDGWVDFKEYLSGAAAINGFSKEDRMAGWKMAFETHLGGAGELEKDKVLEYTARAFPHIAERFEEFWAEADVNGNGKLSESEFLAWAEQRAEEVGIKPQMLMNNLMRMSTMALDADTKNALQL